MAPRWQVGLRPPRLTGIFFSSVMTKCSPLQSDLPVQCPKPESSIHEVEITEVKISEKLRSFKEHKSSGPDNIHVNVLKKTVPLLVSHSQFYSKDRSIKDIFPKIGEMRISVRSTRKVTDHKPRTIDPCL